MRTLLMLVVSASLLGCAKPDNRGKLLPHSEPVLQPEDTITVKHPNGLLTIKAVGEASRQYVGQGWEATLELIPRDVRWFGSAGLCDYTPFSPPFGRMIVDEGRQFFSTESEALRYLYIGSTAFKPVYTNDGLVVGYCHDLVPGGAVRSIRVWQIYINGKKPVSLRGANDFLFKVSGKLAPAEATPSEVKSGRERMLSEKEYQPE